MTIGMADAIKGGSAASILAAAAKTAAAKAAASAKAAAAAVASPLATLTSTTNDVAAGAKTFSSYLPTIFLVLIIIALLIALGLWASGFKIKKKTPAAAATTAALNAATSSSPKLPAEGFQATVDPQPISSEDTTFINLQPLTIKDVGFQGPYPNGNYEPESATANALKAGFRCLILQIDYMDSNKNPEQFAARNEPTLLIRSHSGALLSSNSGDIKLVATTIANLAFRPEVPQSTQPVILYLHIVRAPNATKDPNGYLRFLSKIAEALNPLAPMHLGLTPMGNFTRQKMAEFLLTAPIKSLEGQVVILCNADTSLFRSRSKALDKHYDSVTDLDFWVNMRVFLDSDDDVLGITQPANPNEPAMAVVADMNRLLSLSATKMTAFAEKAKKRYVIAMPSRVENPTAKNINVAINVLGVNCVPIDIFTAPTQEIKSIVGEYGNMTYHPKPIALRNIS